MLNGRELNVGTSNRVHQHGFARDSYSRSLGYQIGTHPPRLLLQIAAVVGAISGAGVPVESHKLMAIASRLFAIVALFSRIERLGTVSDSIQSPSRVVIAIDHFKIPRLLETLTPLPAQPGNLSRHRAYNLPSCFKPNAFHLAPRTARRQSSGSSPADVRVATSSQHRGSAISSLLADVCATDLENRIIAVGF